jgi:hypothetical protein
MGKPSRRAILVANQYSDRPNMSGVTRRQKTPEEISEAVKRFEAAWKQEMAKVMRNAVERMIAPGTRRIPAKYRMKLPRITVTVADNVRVKTLRVAKPSERLPRISPRRDTRRRAEAAARRRIQAAKRRRKQAMELLELRKSLANSMERAIAFRDRRKLPPRYVPKQSRRTKKVPEAVRSLTASIHAAQDKLLKGVRLDRKLGGVPKPKRKSKPLGI